MPRLALLASVLVAAIPPPTDPPVPAVTCDGVTATIVGKGEIHGTAGDDVIVGSSGNDVIRGRGGDDLICGRGGRDRVRAGRGDDRAFGGGGRDRLAGQAGFDIVDGGRGRDRCHSHSSEWVIDCERPVPPDPGDSVNCSDFESQADAQMWFDRYAPHYGDVAHLDNDGDGEACEGLRLAPTAPAPPAAPDPA